MAQKRAALFFIQSVDNLQLHPHAFLRLDLTLKARHDLGELLPHNLNKLDKFGRFRVCKKKKKRKMLLVYVNARKRRCFHLPGPSHVSTQPGLKASVLIPLGANSTAYLAIWILTPALAIEYGTA